MLATFIAAVSLRFRLSRRKIQEFLLGWLGLELGAATIERCVHESVWPANPWSSSSSRRFAAPTSSISTRPLGIRRENCAGCGWRRPRSRPFPHRQRRKEELIELIGEAFWVAGHDGTSLIATIRAASDAWRI